MKKCELCESPARMYCESDQAILCFDCDARVHGANFLVARHSRVLLCDTCQSTTPWRASSARIGRVVSVCEKCATDETKEHDEEEEEEGENQVVPWTASELSPPPPVEESCSSSEAEEEDEEGRDHKRIREDDRSRSFLRTRNVTGSDIAHVTSTCFYGSGSRSGYTRSRRGRY